MIKVLFNDSCPICSKEINHYKSLENDINWIDINDLEISMKLSGKSHEQLISGCMSSKMVKFMLVQGIYNYVA